jgi:large subunit ribosomal protein L11
MAKQSVKVLVEAGKATPGPPLGPALGVLGVNVAQVVAKINEKTAHLEGMKVPVTVIVDTKTKQFEIEVGLPPVSVIIKKELGLEKGSKTAGKEIVGDLPFEKVVKIAKERLGSTLARDLTKAVKEVLGTCVSMGVTVEGKDPREIQREIEEGKRKVE